MDRLLHPLKGVVGAPRRFNNPFYYEPDDLCKQAIREVVDYLEGKPTPSFSPNGPSPEFLAEIAKGKMFGVLVVQAPHHSPTSSDSQSVSSNSQPVSSNSRPISANTHFPSPISPQSPFPTVVSTPLPLGEGSGERLEEQEGRLAGSERPSFLFLSAYSGQICGRSDWPEFVPAVFDYLQEDGYFKREEAEIVKINEEIGNIPRPLRWEGSADAAGRPQMEKGRKDGESEDDYVRRRQFENAELHRWKVAERSRKATFEDEQRQKAEKIQSLKTLRRQKSDSLQRWLFRRFVMRNALGETRNLLDIWGGEAVPPAGSGECCEPKLLQYAFDHGLKPVSMAMFWWGESPREEVRHHLQCYPACNGKCKPILRWMLRGMDVEPNPLEAESRHALPILFEDNDICVVNKPAGMLSVQGKSRRESVQSVMRKRYPDANSPLIVHRLDMATSGLMVIAKTMDAYRGLQRQFLRHEVRKRYVAELTHDLPQREGDITLPLRPDLDDRPRQMVDAVYGKPAETHFERVGDRRVALYPHTGRTHQLRVHCAHRLGLNNPIRGDELYGQRADRLYLHAESLTFTHPRTGESLTFTAPAPF